MSYADHVFLQNCKDILENGILVRPLKQNSCLVVELTAEDN